MARQSLQLRFRDARLTDVPVIAALHEVWVEERGGIVYKGDPLVYYELLL